MKLLLGAAAALMLMAANVSISTPAEARVSFGVSVNAGDVMFAYRDGYWDRGHRWHPWADPDDWRWFRRHYRARYYDWRHDRDADLGWRAIGGSPVGVVVGGPGFEVAVGDVLFAYNDGYWDRWHRWHFWRNEYQRIWWRDHYRDRYWDWRHDRDPDRGWRHDRH